MDVFRRRSKDAKPERSSVGADDIRAWLAAPRSANHRAWTGHPPALIGDDRPSWLVDLQPTKTEWSPVHDREFAATELIEKILEQRRERRRSVFRAVMSPVLVVTSLAEAAVQVTRKRRGKAVPAVAPSHTPEPVDWDVDPTTLPPRPLPLGFIPQPPPLGRERPPSALAGIPIPEVLEALKEGTNPMELDWDLIGVDFVNWPPVHYARPAAPELEPPAVEIQSNVAPEPEPEEQPGQAPLPQPAEKPKSWRGAVVSVGKVIDDRRREQWLREKEEILGAVRMLTWEGYTSMLADIFRREGYAVLAGEGPDEDVIDMEVGRGAERMLVNCQLRGLTQIDGAPLLEMAAVAQRNGVQGTFIVSDGDFAHDAWEVAEQQAVILIDGDTLCDLVVGLTLAGEKNGSKKLNAKVSQLFQPGFRHPHQQAS